jgi:cation diffusion facilitator CzcD-associated flavoprotein CzcO
MDRGLPVRVYGRPMGFWREHMPAGMLLRSGPEWHMDPAGELTFQAFCADPPNPIPLGLYLDYAEWFRREAGIEVIEEELTVLPDAPFVVAAPGVAYFQHRPEWATDEVHTVDYVDFSDASGASYLIVGGRQSAYETAALLVEHGAARVDVVHRHEQPRFAEVSWDFVDAHVQRTVDVPGYWRGLPEAERTAIARRFWEVGRLTLEPWLAPRITDVHVHIGEVVEAGKTVRLSTGAVLEPDRIVLATGYRADLSRVPYLPPLASSALDEHMQSVAWPGLYLPGFTATADFGPFFGFVRGAPAAATLVARHIAAAT